MLLSNIVDGARHRLPVIQENLRKVSLRIPANSGVAMKSTNWAMMCLTASTRTHGDGRHLTQRRTSSEFSDHFTPLDGRQCLIDARVNVLGDESNRTVTEAELSTSRVRAAEVIEMRGRMVWGVVR